jgi:hypothetical protein
MSARFREITEKSIYLLIKENIVHTVPVKEVVAAYKRKKSIWGIEGYELPKFHAHLDKVRNVKIIKDNRPSFLD